VKLAMMELLATTEPGLERLETWNAESNEHMIAVKRRSRLRPVRRAGYLVRSSR